MMFCFNVISPGLKNKFIMWIVAIWEEFFQETFVEELGLRGSIIENGLRYTIAKKIKLSLAVMLQLSGTITSPIAAATMDPVIIGTQQVYSGATSIAAFKLGMSEIDTDYIRRKLKRGIFQQIIVRINF